MKAEMKNICLGGERSRSGKQPLALVWRARTARASLPVLVAHGEDLLHPVVHGFGKPAELLTLLIPVRPQKVNGEVRRPKRWKLSPVRLGSHFMEAQVRSFCLYRGEDHHPHRLILLCFSLSRLPVLSRSSRIMEILTQNCNINFKKKKKRKGKHTHTFSSLYVRKVWNTSLLETTGCLHILVIQACSRSIRILMNSSSNRPGTDHKNR